MDRMRKLDRWVTGEDYFRQGKQHVGYEPAGIVGITATRSGGWGRDQERDGRRSLNGKRWSAGIPKITQAHQGFSQDSAHSHSQSCDIFQ